MNNDDSTLIETNENLAVQEKLIEDEDNVSQVSPDIISFTQLYSIETLRNKLLNGSLSTPAFQRKAGLWSQKNKSLFIESILLNLPIPSIVVFSDSSKQLKVIDGLQRLTTILSFLKNEFTLEGLEQINTEQFNGLSFSALSTEKQNAILNSTISVITVQCQPEDDRSDATYYEIFRRLNQGGLVLTPQEIRNSLYRGKFLDFLRGNTEIGLAGIRDNSTWKELYSVRGNVSHNYARERDVELLLKIFAIAESGDNEVKKNLGDFLNNYLKLANKKSDDEIERIKQAFEKSLEYVKTNNIIEIFKKNKIIGTIWYNILMASLVKYYLQNHTELTNRDFQLLLNHRQDFPSESSDTWNITKIKKWREIFEEFIFGNGVWQDQK